MKNSSSRAKVYYSRQDYSKIIDLLPLQKLAGKVGIKVHVGEMGNETFLVPEYADKVYKRLKENSLNVNLVECNVLYRGSRTNRKDHLATAKKHGFNFAVLDILDGEFGQDNWEISVGLKHFDSILVGAGLKSYDNLIVLSHFKGHGANGFGGALKNLGMGLGSRAGKMAMHAAFDLKINSDLCIGCGICAAKCDFEAITIVEGKAQIDFSKCSRCAGCIANCPQGAVEMPWGGTSSEGLQERIVEYCYGIIKSLNVPLYINIMENITERCDCAGVKMKPIAPNIGYLASSDPVALDQSCLDLLIEETGKDIFKARNGVDSTVQLKYGEKLEIGTRKYQIIEI